MKMGKSRKTQTTKADLIRPKNFNRPVTIRDWKSNQNFPTNKSPGPDNFTGEFN